MSEFATLVSVIYFVVVLIIFVRAESKKLAAMSPAERQEHSDTVEHGPLNPALICPHCQEKGKVSVKSVERNKGIHGTKAAGAALTAGLSLLLIGLSRKEQMTQAYCSNCQSTWEF
jgi:hypothetical protein